MTPKPNHPPAPIKDNKLLMIVWCSGRLLAGEAPYDAICEIYDHAYLVGYHCGMNTAKHIP